MSDPYCSVARYREVVTGTGATLKNRLPNGVDADATLTRFLVAASARVDGYLLAAGYAAPVDPAVLTANIGLAAILEARTIQAAAELYTPAYDAVDPATGAQISKLEEWGQRLIGAFGMDAQGRLVRAAQYESLPGIARAA